jgi:hypothetical protein
MAHRAKGKVVFVGLTCLGLILPPSALEAARRGKSPQSRRPGDDVALDSAGYLHGRAVDLQGRPLADQPVVLGRAGRRLAPCRTDGAGRFRVGPLRGGPYSLSAGGQARLVRVWPGPTAPPSAAEVALVVAQGDVVRGQMPMEQFLASDAVIIGAMIAAAITLPIVMHNSSDSRPHSP